MPAGDGVTPGSKPSVRVRRQTVSDRLSCDSQLHRWLPAAPAPPNPCRTRALGPQQAWRIAHAAWLCPSQSQTRVGSPWQRQGGRWGALPSHGAHTPSHPQKRRHVDEAFERWVASGAGTKDGGEDGAGGPAEVRSLQWGRPIRGRAVLLCCTYVETHPTCARHSRRAAAPAAGGRAAGGGEWVRARGCQLHPGTRPRLAWAAALPLWRPFWLLVLASG
jgi:hypothetical protein